MEYLTIELLGSVVTGAVIGALIHVTGVGGGVLIIPALVLLFALPVTVAVGTASIFSTLTKCVSGINHTVAGTVSWRITFWFLVGAIPATLLAAFSVVHILTHYPQQGELLQPIMRYFVIAVMLASVALIVFSDTTTARGSGFSITRLIIFGALIGAIMAYSGVGGGVLIIPALALATDEQMKKIVSCSIVISVAVSMLTGLIYAKGGQVDLPILVGLLIGSVLGIAGATPIGKHVSNTQLTRAVLGLIVISAGMMAFL